MYWMNLTLHQKKKRVTLMRNVQVYILINLPWCRFNLFETPASFSMGWAAFMCISPNVKEEGAMKEDTGTQDTPYTEVSAYL